MVSTIEETPLNQLELDKQELESLLQHSESHNVQCLLKDYINNLNNSIKSQISAQEKVKDLANKEAIKFIPLTRYAWTDSKACKVYISENIEGLDSHDPSKVKVTFMSKGFEIEIYDWKGKNYKFILHNLIKDYNEKESTYKISKTGITVSLKNLKDNDMWMALKQ